MSSGFVGVAVPDVRKLYLVADVCPDPRPGRAYQLWLGDDGSFRPVGAMFVPRSGSVLIELTVDVGAYDEVWITEEIAGEAPTTPSVGGRSWRAELP
jgi:Anti-sigma-K factor rskA